MPRLLKTLSVTVTPTGYSMMKKEYLFFFFKLMDLLIKHNKYQDYLHHVIKYGILPIMFKA